MLLLALLPTSLCLFCLVHASQETLAELRLPKNVVNITELPILPNSTISEIIEESHVHTSDCLHGNESDLEFETPSGPWSHEVECIDDTETGYEYCVYTNATFNNGRGISLFTTPSIAAEILTLPAFTSPPPTKNPSTPPWEIRAIPGRGNALFATRLLERGDLILADTPVGIYQSDAFFPDYEIGYKYLRKTFEQLPEEGKKVFLRMQGKDAEGGDTVMERINVNAFAGEFEGKACFFLYPETAMMNHDCRPNAMYYHNPNTLIHSTHASRTIQPGEEITITYINLLQPHSSRQSTLQQMWGFQCTCALCTCKPTQRQASEARVYKINNLQSALADWSPSSGASPDMAEKLMKLYAREDLHAAAGMGFMFAALAYNAVGDTVQAQVYAERAIEAGIVGTADSETDAEEMRALMRKPQRHWSYGVRNRGVF